MQNPLRMHYRLYSKCHRPWYVCKNVSKFYFKTHGI